MGMFNEKRSRRMRCKDGPGSHRRNYPSEHWKREWALATGGVNPLEVVEIVEDVRLNEEQM